MPRHDRLLGTSAPELGWVPTPSHVLRRAAILELLGDGTPGRMLEVGCGSGALLRDLAALGFSGTAVDASVEAIELAKVVNSDLSNKFELREELPPTEELAFDYIMAFEVLEHIQDDAVALRQWLTRLKNNGDLVFSVPAHRARWSDADEWAGHVRRYDRSDIYGLLANAGCEVVDIRCYGFPLLNLLAPVSHFAGRRKMARLTKDLRGRDRAEATARSGIDRRVESRLYGIYSSTPARILFRTAIALQRRFMRTDRGTGYLVRARKLPA